VEIKGKEELIIEGSQSTSLVVYLRLKRKAIDPTEADIIASGAGSYAPRATEKEQRPVSKSTETCRQPIWVLRGNR
jgi:hypothetical protein